MISYELMINRLIGYLDISAVSSFSRKVLQLALFNVTRGYDAKVVQDIGGPLLRQSGEVRQETPELPSKIHPAMSYEASLQTYCAVCHLSTECRNRAAESRFYIRRRYFVNP